jgi:recombination protein RecT
MEEKEIKVEETKVEKVDKQELIKKEKVAEEMGLVVPKNMGDYVNNTMENYMKQGLVLPSDYNVQNAVISSYLIIKQDEKFNKCTKDSIASALVDMATMGLNASKHQCYFVPYSGQLQLSPSYFGKIMAIKRIKGVIDVRADVLYKNTEYELLVDEYGNDDIKINKACPLEERTFENLIGAWCRILLNKEVWGSDSYVTIMTLDQIKKSWNQGAMKGQSPAHKNFQDEMMKKSVINRCCKNFVNSAKDNDILIETLNRTTENDYLDENDRPFVIKEDKVIDL